MKTTKEVLQFCNAFTFYNRSNIDRVIGMNFVRDYKPIVLSEKDFKKKIIVSE